MSFDYRNNLEFAEAFESRKFRNSLKSEAALTIGGDSDNLESVFNNYTNFNDREYLNLLRVSLMTMMDNPD